MAAATLLGSAPAAAADATAVFTATSAAATAPTTVVSAASFAAVQILCFCCSSYLEVPIMAKTLYLLENNNRVPGFESHNRRSFFHLSFMRCSIE